MCEVSGVSVLVEDSVGLQLLDRGNDPVFMSTGKTKTKNIVKLVG